jgi:ribonuclease Z
MPTVGLTILGNNSALPANERHPTAQALHWDDQVYLIDCGEGTQLQLNRYKIRRSKINHIFISHLHGDHYFGLIGLITSMGLMGRESPLHLYAPPGLEAIVTLQLKLAETRLPFALHFHTLGTEDTALLSDKHVTVRSFAVQHRIPCWGFLFIEQKAPRMLLKEAAMEAGVPQVFFNRLKWGENYVTEDGRFISNNSVTAAAAPPVSYAYCADTLYTPALADKLAGVTLLYHEATYLHELVERAESRFHSTARQAAMLAAAAKPQRLLIGHFSSQYDNLDDFLMEAREVFPATDLAQEGVTYLLKQRRPSTSKIIG